MLKISNKALASFAQTGKEEFIDSVLSTFQHQYGFDIQTHKKSLYKSISNQIEKAQSYGLKTNKQIFTYILTATLIDSEFDQYIPQARKILLNQTLNADQKEHWLKQFTIALYSDLENKGVISSHFGKHG